MKTTIVIISVLLMLAPLGTASAMSAAAANIVVLTADQVHTAVDIENAFRAATTEGTRPGQVVLDGSRGVFRYDPAYGDDFDINIFYSNLVLRGQNNAVIEGGGINLDGMELRNITIENLGIICPADCITSTDGLHLNVKITGNRIVAVNDGIQVIRTDSWLIQRNTIQSDNVGIYLLDVNEMVVQYNMVTGFLPIRMQQVNSSVIKGNSTFGGLRGIYLVAPSTSNQIAANSILAVQSAGITLADGTQDNDVVGNFVRCARGYACLTVEALGSAAEDNNIWGNRP